MDDRPWLHPEAVEKLEEILHPHFVVFEWGAGGSTIWLAQRVAMIISVEHAPGWAERISAHLVALGLMPRAILVHIPPDVKAQGQADYDEYAGHILKFSSGYFDLVFIDGRDRNRCMENARDKVRCGGWIVLDNSQRKEYARGIASLIDWLRIDADGLCRGVGPNKDKLFPNRTTFFQKVI